MAKINIEHSLDFMDIPCLIVSKKKGKLNYAEVYEECVKAGIYGPHLIPIRLNSEMPEDLFDEGDEWTLYAPENLYPKIAEDKFNEGYEAALKDNGLADNK